MALIHLSLIPLRHWTFPRTSSLDSTYSSYSLLNLTLLSALATSHYIPEPHWIYLHRNGVLLLAVQLVLGVTIMRIPIRSQYRTQHRPFSCSLFFSKFAEIAIVGLQVSSQTSVYLALKLSSGVIGFRQDVISQCAWKRTGALKDCPRQLL